MKSPLTFFLTTLLSLSCAGETIQGLSYIDGKPVSIEVDNGIIGSIQSIEDLSGENAWTAVTKDVS